MKKQFIVSTLVLAGALAAGAVSADPYASWRSSDDDQVIVRDSFNRESSFESSYDSTHSEDNDETVTKTHSEDNDVAISKDFDYTSIYRTSEDNDVTTTITEDNDVTKSWQESTDIDFQIATPTMSSYKFQDQDAGHQSDTSVLGIASGHSVGVEGGTNFVSAGNDETVYYGPALVNTNVNQLPQNNLFISGSNVGSPISMANTLAGRDMGPKGVFAPIGNTSAAVQGDVGNQAGASTDQSGDSANKIADPFSSGISK